MSKNGDVIRRIAKARERVLGALREDGRRIGGVLVGATMMLTGSSAAHATTSTKSHHSVAFPDDSALTPMFRDIPWVNFVDFGNFRDFSDFHDFRDSR